MHVCGGLKSRSLVCSAGVARDSVFDEADASQGDWEEPRVIAGLMSVNNDLTHEREQYRMRLEALAGAHALALDELARLRVGAGGGGGGGGARTLAARAGRLRARAGAVTRARRRCAGADGAPATAAVTGDSGARVAQLKWYTDLLAEEMTGGATGRRVDPAAGARRAELLALQVRGARVCVRDGCAPTVLSL